MHLLHALPIWKDTNSARVTVWPFSADSCRFSVLDRSSSCEVLCDAKKLNYHL
uniref:Uncharacterized protein n=1 Tax=Mesocestoides corti TaxID=53468 RepID=A0A5K3EM01_MESCO